jgi:site-specific recombinase XerD
MIDVDIIFYSDTEARLAGYWPINEVIEKIRPGDRSNYVKQIKNPKHPFKGCQVREGSRAYWYLLLSSLKEDSQAQQPKKTSSFHELKAEWFHLMKSGAFTGKPCSESHVDNNLEYGFRNFFKILSVEESIEAITAENFSKVMASDALKVDEIARNDRFSTKTHIFRACTRFIDFLIEKGLKTKADREAFAKYKPKPKYLIKQRLLDREQIDSWIRFNCTWNDGRVRFDIDSTDLLLHLYAFAGLRRMEAASLRISDIDFKNDEMIVMGKGSKERIIDLTLFPVLKPTMIKWIHKYRKSSHSDLLIVQADGTPLTESSINLRFQRLRIALNFPSCYEQIRSEFCFELSSKEMRTKAWELARKAKAGPRTHKLRGAFATMLADDGLPLHLIQELMGHSSIETTMGYISSHKKQIRNWSRSRHLSALVESDIQQETREVSVFDALKTMLNEKIS